MISVVVVLLLCFAKASIAAYLVTREPAIPAAMFGFEENLQQSEKTTTINDECFEFGSTKGVCLHHRSHYD
jgi:hypothetical protein